MPLTLITSRTTPSPPQRPPGLSALVIYLRPAARPELLAELARLGLFVTEATASDLPALFSGQLPPPEIVVLVGRTCEEHLDLIRALRTRLTPAIFCIWPAHEDSAEATAAGALAVGFDGPAGALTSLLVPVARHARTAREAWEAAAPVPPTVFEHLKLKSDPPRLEQGGNLVKLSDLEYSLLDALVRRQGHPVAVAELRRAITLAGGRGPKRDAPVRLGSTIARLRRKAGRLGGDTTALGNVRGFGYVLTG